MREKMEGIKTFVKMTGLHMEPDILSSNIYWLGEGGFYGGLKRFLLLGLDTFDAVVYNSETDNIDIILKGADKAKREKVRGLTTALKGHGYNVNVIPDY